MTIGKRASANAVIKAVMSQASAIGKSKTAAKADSQVRGQNGHKVSTQAHSIKSIQNLRSVTTQYVNFIKANHGNRVVGHINKETVKEFLLSKNISGGSLNTYISTMAKVADNFNKIGIQSIERKDIHNIRTEFKNNNINLSKNHINRAYQNTEKIIQNVETSSSYGLSVRLSVSAGLRIGDATNSNKWKLNNDNTLTINQSKNGLNYKTLQLDNNTENEVKEAIAEGYKIDKTEYSTALKEAVESTGQEYNGTHGLRYSFAQERFSELKEYGYTHSEALAEISLNMGHSREEISKHYLNFD